MVDVSLASAKDIEEAAKFGIDFQRTRGLITEIPGNYHDFFWWLLECFQSFGTYVFLAKHDGKVCGILVLSESACPWNREYHVGYDNLFIAERGGLKLLRTAKELKKRKNWHHLILTTSAKQERTDLLFSKIADRVGGVYEL